MQLLLVIVGVLTASGLFMQALRILAVSELARKHRRRQDRPSRVTPAEHRRSVIINSVLPATIFLTVPIAFQSRFVTMAPAGAWRVLGEATLILLVNDFVYYFLHRFGFHGWSVGRRIHSMHHTIRTPYVLDALYVHPVETAGGVLGFLLSAALVGPVGLWSFGLAFLVYSLENLFIHSGIDLPFFPFNFFMGLVRNHERHHESMKGGYYASTTPIWDIVFRTTRPKDAPAPG